mmetsp:Transcript_17960/g.31757  ORF Transcript_17960/g.31757 Transcript_17960/m.31757 type:complete len:154 (-) Transcript_17960:895-1356(-)
MSDIQNAEMQVEDGPAWGDVTASSVSTFSLEGKVVDAKVVSVYDGDTVTIATFCLDGVNCTAFKCRLVGINTPEIRTRDKKEKVAGYAARDALREVLEGRVVKVRCGPFDKYGRLLATIEAPGVGDVAEMLVTQGHAMRYDGGRRLPFYQWEI